MKIAPRGLAVGGFLAFATLGAEDVRRCSGQSNYTVRMDAITIFGMFAVTAMLVCMEAL